MSQDGKQEQEIRIRLANPLVGDEELDAIRKVLGSGALTNGPETARFEALFADMHQVPHAVAFANGTVALAAMFLSTGIGPGDEIIVPSLTFISSATSVMHVGATPVFAEVDTETFNIDPDDIKRRITANTKGVLAVHYGGQAADMESLLALSQEHDLILFEDAAEAHGATYLGRPVGGWGKAGMFSFTPTKNITTGEGGMVTTSDAGMAERLRRLRNHGQVSPYVHADLGYNWRITEMQAAMGIVQLQRLPDILQKKRANAEWMARRLQGVPGIRLPVTRPDRDHAYMLFTLWVESDRDALLDELLSHGIEARIYFPPAHRQAVFAHLEARLPATESICRHILSIPFHVQLTEVELEEISAVISRHLAKQTMSG